MALPTQQFSSQHIVDDQPHQSLDKQTYGFDNDSSLSILDPSILESEMIQHQVDGGFRKDSFAASHGILTPTDGHWNSHFQESPAQSSGLFKGDTQYVDNLQQNANMAHNAWNMASRSGNGTPTSALDMMAPPPHFDNMHYMQHKMNEQRPYEQRQYTNIQAEPRYMSTNSQAQAGAEYMALAQAEVESRSLSRRLRSDSPPRPIADIHRRDAGIHKKNKRIEIPNERNIQTIDQLIETTKDEDLLKELKAQKRLLRNREAALASRQRKKKHTEDLESKEKVHQNQVTSLEQQVEDLIVQRDALDQQRQILFHQNQEKEHMIEALQMERRDMMMKHNEETAILRRKVQILTEQLESGPAPLMSAAPSSTGFTDFNAEMEALNMGPHDWDNFLFMPESHAEATDAGFGTPHAEVKSSCILEKTPTNAVTKGTEQPVASGLLFMLLLCGAFVASRPGSTNSLDLPSMPEDVRLAAPTVLSNLLSESNNARHTDGYEPIPSMHPLPQRSNNNHRMTQMHRSLTAPTRQQEIDSAFSLTASQYASLSNSDMPIHDDLSTTPRRNLAQALAEHNLESDNKAEIYTRSLLWEHIPREVVDQFKDLVREHRDLTTHEQ